MDIGSERASPPPGQCAHLLPSHCENRNEGECCACADDRPYARSYTVRAANGVMGSASRRWQWYCPSCYSFWDCRVQRAGLDPAQTRIPHVPNQDVFLERWYEFYRGRRFAQRGDGSEVQLFVMGENVMRAEIGQLPRTFEQMAESAYNAEAATAWNNLANRLTRINQQLLTNDEPELDLTLSYGSSSSTDPSNTSGESQDQDVHMADVESEGSNSDRASQSSSTRVRIINRFELLARDLGRMRDNIGRNMPNPVRRVFLTGADLPYVTPPGRDSDNSSMIADPGSPAQAMQDAQGPTVAEQRVIIEGLGRSLPDQDERDAQRGRTRPSRWAQHIRESFRIEQEHAERLDRIGQRQQQSSQGQRRHGRSSRVFHSVNLQQEPEQLQRVQRRQRNEGRSQGEAGREQGAQGQHDTVRVSPDELRIRELYARNIAERYAQRDHEQMESEQRIQELEEQDEGHRRVREQREQEQRNRVWRSEQLRAAVERMHGAHLQRARQRERNSPELPTSPSLGLDTLPDAGPDLGMVASAQASFDQYVQARDQIRSQLDSAEANVRTSQERLGRLRDIFPNVTTRPTADNAEQDGTGNGNGRPSLLGDLPFPYVSPLGRMPGLVNEPAFGGGPDAGVRTSGRRVRPQQQRSTLRPTNPDPLRPFQSVSLPDVEASLNDDDHVVEFMTFVEQAGVAQLQTNLHGNAHANVPINVQANIQRDLADILGRRGSHIDPRGLDAPNTGRPEERPESELTINMECNICMAQLAEVASMPCGHLSMCRWCSQQHSPGKPDDLLKPQVTARCPICRKRIRRKVMIYRG